MSAGDDEMEQVRLGLRRWSAEQLKQGLLTFEQRSGAASRRAALPPARTRLVLGGLVMAGAVSLLLVVVAFGRMDRKANNSDKANGQTSALVSSRREASGQGLAARDQSYLFGDDGSRVTLNGEESQLQVAENHLTRVVVLLTRGRATFEIQHRPDRQFVVEVGAVRIEDLGTLFEIERQPSVVLVKVSKGEVRVSWGDQAETLTEGGRGAYPLVVGDNEKNREPPPRRKDLAPPAQSWRVPARDGDYGPAFRLLQQEGLSTVHDEPEDLLLAADVARLSGHPVEAVAPLRRLIRQHPRDSRSAAAAFMLGSVLLRNLHRPSEAAAAYEEAQKLAPHGNLAQDASARAAEAWMLAGDRSRAEAALARYEAAYPNGPQAAALARMIRVDPR